MCDLFGLYFFRIYKFKITLFINRSSSNVKEERKRNMKEKGKKFISLVLTFLMSIGCVSAYPSSVSALEKDYEVYPNPHMMDYQDGSFDMTLMNIQRID